MCIALIQLENEHMIKFLLLQRNVQQLGTLALAVSNLVKVVLQVHTTLRLDNQSVLQYLQVMIFSKHKEGLDK